MTRKILDSKVVLIIAVVLYLLVVSPQIMKPLQGDEYIYLKAAKSINETGIPQHYDSDYEKETGKFILSIGHPTTQIHYIASAFLLGLPERLIRLTSLIPMLLSLVLFYGIVKIVIRKDDIISKVKKKKEKLLKIVDEKNFKKLLILGFLLYLINPLSLQGSMLVDIDNSLLLLTMMLFVFVFLNFWPKLNWKRSIILGLAYGLMLYMKFGLALVTLIAIGIFLWVNRNFKESLVKTATIGISGFAFMAVGWFVYTTNLGLDFFYPFFANVKFGLPRFELWDFLVLQLGYGGFKTNIFWITPAFFLLIMGAAYVRGKEFLKSRKLEIADFLGVYALLIFFQYIFIGHSAWRMPKYIIPALPLFAIFVGKTLLDMRIDFKKLNKKLVVLGFVITGLLIAFVADPLLQPKSFEELVLITVYYFLPLLILTILFVLSEKFGFGKVFEGKFESEKKLRKVNGIFGKFGYRGLRTIYGNLNFTDGKKIFAALVVVYLASAAYIDIVQFNAPYSTGFNYGERGMLEAAEYVKSITKPGEMIEAGPGGVAYYAGVRHYISWGDSSDCIGKLEKMGARVAVVNQNWDGKYSPKFIKCMDEKFKRNDFGTYSVYEKVGGY